MFLVSRCEEFNGIQPYDWNPAKLFCCPPGCGTCGGGDCGTRPGGEQSCCRRGIPEEQICGANGQMAPCHLEQIGKKFIR